MASPINIYYVGVAPIPVGHRVEIRTYFIETGVFRKKKEPNFNDPMIIDLDTGVVYSDVANFKQVGSYHTNSRIPVPTVPRPDLQLHGRWQGVIRQCQVLWIGFGDSRYPQTTLVVEPFDPQPT